MKVIINGSAGRMGVELTRLAKAGCRGAEYFAGVDLVGNDSGDPCYQNLKQVPKGADCIIDFTHHSVTEPLLTYAVKNNLPVILATTGHTDSELKAIRAAAKKIPVFFSANMSMGVALLTELAKKAAAVYPEADIEIIETHHNRKLDAPSGTALMIAEALKKVRMNTKFIFGRSGQAKREPGEIGIHAVRRGNIVGTHEVLVSTDSETITLKHEAHSRALFAEGAMAAAAFLWDKPAGLYTMQDMIKF